jgi:hypothetical protein
VIKAASEVTAKGFAKLTLLGDPVAIAAEAKKLGADISGCAIVHPAVRGGGGGGGGWVGGADRGARQAKGAVMRTCRRAGVQT